MKFLLGILLPGKVRKINDQRSLEILFLTVIGFYQRIVGYVCFFKASRKWNVKKYLLKSWIIAVTWTVPDLPQGQLGLDPGPWDPGSPKSWEKNKTVGLNIFMILNKFRMWFCTSNALKTQLLEAWKGPTPGANPMSRTLNLILGALNFQPGPGPWQR